MSNLNLLHDIEVTLTVELGRTRLSIRELLSLSPGNLVELDTQAHAPVKVFANGKLIAMAEVVTINHPGKDVKLGLRIVEVFSKKS